jgi:predicted dehydrogenase
MANLASKTVLTNGHAEKSDTQLSFLIIGAGSRGNAYANALEQSSKNFPTRIGAVAEPIESKRRAFQRKYVHPNEPVELFETWQQFVEYEEGRRKGKTLGEYVPKGVDGVFVCTLDETHAEIITAFAPLGLHIMSEKPLATTLSDCLKIYRSLQPPGTSTAQAIFSIGHVLRYSPHNMLLRKLLLEDDVIGDIVSIEHTEPVGWWHFSHSYVR